ncbi:MULTISPECIES: hypothetical protein [Chryseobacterium]|uniref:hypothetical protein n=1 Tax=Chryseobacterium TaxID=59732 RepID=UPI0013EF0BED|nr:MULTISPECIES: hypothetical protein [Chryseobacterium]QQV02161.1 hypothetical protein I6I61_13940 [Chryseobacterium sp. FDAARGOS 1104]
MITKNLSLVISLGFLMLSLMLGIFIENTIYSHLFTLLAIVIGADCLQKFSPQNNKDNE